MEKSKREYKAKRQKENLRKKMKNEKRILIAHSYSVKHLSERELIDDGDGGLTVVNKIVKKPTVKSKTKKFYSQKQTEEILNDE